MAPKDSQPNRASKMPEDIYNMDETGFQMGITLTSKVVCGLETKQKPC